MMMMMKMMMMMMMMMMMSVLTLIFYWIQCTWCLQRMILLVFFLVTQVAAGLTNSSGISEGFCDQNLVNLTLTIDCDFDGIEVSIHMNKTNFDVLTLQCNKDTCQSFGQTSLEYVLTNETLDVSFPFRHSEHAGKYINFRTTCQNPPSIPDHAFLKPCLSQFTGNATVDGPNVTLYCEHPSYNESTSGIRITSNGNDLASCFNQTCVTGNGLPNGAYTEVKFNTGMIFLCKMDGAVFNLTDKIIEVTSTQTQTQTTLLTTSMTSENTSSLTPQSSLSLSTSSVTGT
ncbi:uncharacterized protein LOC144617551 [Crassostrea virginica]